MDRVYQYMNQEKLNLYDEKTLELGKHTIFGRKGGGGQPDSQKKNVSVGLFSMFRHPLEYYSTL